MTLILVLALAAVLCFKLWLLHRGKRINYPLCSSKKAIMSAEKKHLYKRHVEHYSVIRNLYKKLRMVRGPPIVFLESFSHFDKVFFR